MTIYVRRDGRLVDKASLYRKAIRLTFPTPMLSRLDPYESPIDGHEVTSWGEREREMRENDCYDPRDLPRDHVYEKGRVKHG